MRALIAEWRRRRANRAAPDLREDPKPADYWVSLVRVERELDRILNDIGPPIIPGHDS